MGILESVAAMEGPEFLFLYAIWLVMTRGAVTVLRNSGCDTPVTTLGGLALYEGVGVLRIWAGSAAGMHRWEILVLMMILGAFVFFIRAEHFPERRSGGSCSSSGGGGCGGGGGSCGGGGCGGCGG